MLKRSGIAIALPFLDAMNPVFGKVSNISKSPKRFVAMNAALGFHGPNLFPEKEGRDYLGTPYLKILDDFRSDLRVFELERSEQALRTSLHFLEDGFFFFDLIDRRTFRF